MNCYSSAAANLIVAILRDPPTVATWDQLVQQPSGFFTPNRTVRVTYALKSIDPEAVWDEAMHLLRRHEEVQLMLVVVLAYVVWPWLAASALRVWPGSPGGRRQDFAHCLRASVYSLDGWFWYGLLLWALVVYRLYAPTRGAGEDVAEIITVCVVFAGLLLVPWMIYRQLFTCAVYLEMGRRWTAMLALHVAYMGGVFGVCYLVVA